jgi:hypothetical protein
MSSGVVLALVVLAVALVLGLREAVTRARTGRDAAAGFLPPDVQAGLLTIDAAAAASLDGAAVSEETLKKCGLAVQAFYRHLSRVTGKQDNSAFSPEQQASFFLSAVKVATLDHPDHNAWPLMASIRRSVLEPLTARLGSEQNAWIKLALITPALLRRDVEFAARLYHELPARLAAVARAWVLESAIGYKDFNDVPSALGFLEQVKAPTAPMLLADDPLDAARRWAISVAVHPSYARDPRIALEDPLPEAVCRLALDRWWSITDEESALATLCWLRDAGHREELAQTLQALEDDDDDGDERASFVRTHTAELRSHAILAWDLCRLVQVARTCTKAAYLSEAQGWSFVVSAARDLQQEYASWDAMGDDYLLGNRFFASGAEPEPIHRASVEWLERAPESPWRRLPWDLPLDSNAF